MKAKTATTLMAAASLTLLTSACGRQAQPPRQQQEPQTQQTDVELRDYGAEPTVLNIDSYTLTNENFRTTLWTGGNLQLTVMAIPVGGEVGLEQHHDIDQFLRIEQGTARVLMGDSRDRLDFVREASADFAILVPAGKWHNILNTGQEPLKLYSVYAPAEHPHGRCTAPPRKPQPRKPSTGIETGVSASCRRQQKPLQKRGNRHMTCSPLVDRIAAQATVDRVVHPGRVSRDNHTCKANDALHIRFPPHASYLYII